MALIIMLASLAVLAVAGVVATLVVASRDGLRREPTIALSRR